ncbi:MAG: ATP--guanido phosphotransferase [Clostridia bacterium]|nr:ATP--guanido phosphotransferase [Clostridia bacterium]
MTNWYEIPGNENDVVVSSRVRLARNLAEYPFEPRLTAEQAKEICEKLKAVYSDGWTYVDFSALSPAEKRSYGEKHLVSPAFTDKKTPCALLSKNSVHIMALEEDHLRIQSIYPGLALEEAWHDAREADRLLDENANVAYTEKLGYLTHCPTNLGTGMRASVMLFLPSYTAANGIQSLTAQLSKIGLTIRGMYGEGTAAEGCLYQISNQITLGITEEETIRKLETVVKQIVEKERQLRERQDKEALADRVSRTLGILLYARRMESAELLRLYTNLRLGASMKLLDGITPTMADRMLVESMPGTLTLHAGLENDSAVRDRTRAERIREILGEDKK